MSISCFLPHVLGTTAKRPWMRRNAAWVPSCCGCSGWLCPLMELSSSGFQATGMHIAHRSPIEDRQNNMQSNPGIRKPRARRTCVYVSNSIVVSTRNTCGCPSTRSAAYDPRSAANDFWIRKLYYKNQSIHSLACTTFLRKYA